MFIYFAAPSWSSAFGVFRFYEACLVYEVPQENAAKFSSRLHCRYSLQKPRKLQQLTTKTSPSFRASDFRPTTELLSCWLHSCYTASMIYNIDRPPLKSSKLNTSYLHNFLSEVYYAALLAAASSLEALSIRLISESTMRSSFSRLSGKVFQYFSRERVSMRVMRNGIFSASSWAIRWSAVTISQYAGLSHCCTSYFTANAIRSNWVDLF